MFPMSNDPSGAKFGAEGLLDEKNRAASWSGADGVPCCDRNTCDDRIDISPTLS